MHSDHIAYFKFASPIRLSRSINTLSGIIEGIGIDRKVYPSEIEFLKLWVQEHMDLRHRHPFNEIIPAINTCLSDGVLDEEEKKDLLWLCRKLMSENGYACEITAGIQVLHGILAGIIADGKIEEAELNGLRHWLEDHNSLRTCWPYDEVDSLITEVMRDGKIDSQEHAMLLSFFSEFLSIGDDRTITQPAIQDGVTLTGLCAVDPEISFDGSTFSFTGASYKYRRKEIAGIIENLGGIFKKNVSQKTNYLIIGAEGNPCWAYCCYGRKVEQAVEYRKQGIPIVLVHEIDFHDAIAGV